MLFHTWPFLVFLLIVLPVSEIRARYLAHFGPSAERHAA